MPGWIYRRRSNSGWREKERRREQKRRESWDRMVAASAAAHGWEKTDG